MRNQDIEGIKKGRWDKYWRLPTLNCRQSSDCVCWHHYLGVIYCAGKSASRKLTKSKVPGTAAINSKELITLLV